MAEGGSSGFDIKHYWAIVFKRRYLALAVCLPVVSIFTWGSYLMPKTYEASSTVFIERSQLIDPLIRGVGVSANMEERLRNLKSSMTSRNIVERAVKKLDLDTTVTRSQRYEGLLESIRKNINVNVKVSQGQRETDLFTISYRGSDPGTVRDVVNTLVSEYIEENMKFRRGDAFGAYEFIEGQLMEYKRKLEESDKAIREFREKNPSMVPQSETTLLARMETFQAQKIEGEIKLKELIRKRENLQKQLSGEKELTVAVVTRDSPQARLTFLENQLIQLMSKYTDRHPEIIKVRGEIEELKRQIAHAKESTAQSAGSETSAINPIYQQIKEEFSKTDNEIESLRARLSEIARQQQETSTILGRKPKEQEEWVRLQRDRNVYQKIYDDLVQKLENARVSKDLELTDKNPTFRIVDPAIRPSLPAKPDRVMMILAGILLGIASGVGVAVGLEFLDRSFKDEGSVTEALKLPVLVAIPRMRRESEEVAEKRRDRKVFAAAAAYLVIIGLVFTMEVMRKFMGITIVDI